MLDRLANWKTILIIFLVAVVGFNVILFPWRSGRLQVLAGQKQVGIIDTMYARFARRIRSMKRYLPMATRVVGFTL